jgi:Cupin-like domain
LELQAVPRCNSSVFRPSRLPLTPCVVPGIARHWPALHSWGPEYLKKTTGGVMVDVRETLGAPRNVYQNTAIGGSITFADYLDWVMEMASSDDLQRIAAECQDAADIMRKIGDAGFNRSYYLDVDLACLSPRLLVDVDAPPWYRRAPLRALLWLGVLGTSCGLHADVTPNCNVQVIGRKSFILFSPSQTRLLYRARRSTHCGFDPNDPNYERYPLAERARGMECTLEAGDALYIPVGWYHQVTVVSLWAINVNFFWPRPFLQGLMTPALWRIFFRRAWARWRIKGKHAVLSSRIRRGSDPREILPPTRLG